MINPASELAGPPTHRRIRPRNEFLGYAISVPLKRDAKNWIIWPPTAERWGTTQQL